jgi:hypothetical protein
LGKDAFSMAFLCAGWSMLSAGDVSLRNLIPAFLVARSLVFLRRNIARRVDVNGNKVRGFEKNPGLRLP